MELDGLKEEKIVIWASLTNFNLVTLIIKKSKRREERTNKDNKNGKNYVLKSKIYTLETCVN